jgi:hypothetical protein
MFSRKGKPPPRALVFGIMGGVATFVFFLIIWVLPRTGIPALLTMTLAAAYVVLVGCVVLRISGNGTSWSEMDQMALATGALSFFVIFAPIQELNQAMPAAKEGMGLVGLTFAVVLGYMAWKIHRRVSGAPRFCANCGAQIVRGAIYCHECGVRTEG